MKIRDRLGISIKRQQQLSRSMQILLAIIVLIGLYAGNTGVIVNGLVGIFVTFLPAFLEKKHDLVMDPALVLWITSAVFLHAVGTVALPGSQSFYRSLWWWDHMTHMLSSSIVAAGGYAAVRALDEHHDDIYLPRKFMFVFIFIFVLAFGVIWELLEFGISGLADMLGSETVLTQYGLEDTMKDIMFNTAGGMLVAFFGEIYLLGIIDQLRQKMEEKI
jgi:hypothetical protein